MDLRRARQPFLREQVLEQRLGEGRLALVQVVAVVGVGHTLAAAEGREQRLERLDRAGEGPGQRRDVAQTRRIEQRLVATLREPVAAGVSVGLQLEQAARCLVLQPLARVTLVDARGLSEFC